MRPAPPSRRTRRWVTGDRARVSRRRRDPPTGRARLSLPRKNWTPSTRPSAAASCGAQQEYGRTKGAAAPVWTRRLPSTRAPTSVLLGVLAARAALLAAAVLLVDRGPGAALGLLLGDSPLLVALLDVL